MSNAFNYRTVEEARRVIESRGGKFSNVQQNGTQVYRSATEVFWIDPLSNGVRLRIMKSCNCGK